MTVSEITREQVEAGIALYSRFFLSIYDWVALGLGCRLALRCPSAHLLEMYNRHVTANHLDIGVGTGYFLDKCRFPSASPRLALMDLNPNSLTLASRRLARYSPETYRRNVLEPFDLEAPHFDSIGLMNLLHCLPGDMGTKQAVFENVKPVLNRGGTVFGSTIFYRGVKRNLLARAMLAVTNRTGIMTNIRDDIQVLRDYLSGNFRESSVRVIGCEALFWAVK